MTLDSRHFEPWIGQHYGDGFKNGLKLLVLGESHYDPDNGADAPSYTKAQVQDFLDHGNRGYRFDLGGRLNRMLSDRDEPTVSEARRAWARCAYANYIPIFVGTSAAAKKSSEHWRIGAEHLEHLLLGLEPDRVLVFGRMTWKHINLGHWENEQWRAGGITRGLWRFDVGERIALATWLRHPSWPCNVQTMRDVLDALMIRG